MKTIFLIIILFSFISCAKNNSDLDVKEGDYRTIFPCSIDSVILNDVWFLRRDSFCIYRDGKEIYKTGIQWNGNKMELFPYGSNPYYNLDFSGGKIETVQWGFRFYPHEIYKGNEISFTLERFY